MKYKFTACWSDKLGAAIKEQSKGLYPMALTKTEAECVKAAVNKGIDSHLEACFMPDRGDSYVWNGHRMECEVSPESLPVLVRRLMESGNEAAESLASCICEVLDIELI